MNYQSEQINDLISALAKAQGEMSSAAKDTKGYNYKYADLASVWGACREPLSRNGLAVTQVETQNEHGDVLVTILGHSSGQWMRSIMAIRVKASGKMNELQERGSVLTYLRRYALSAIVGIAPAEDDDGKSGNGYQAKTEPPVEKKPVEPKMINEFQIGVLIKELEACSQVFRDKLDSVMKDHKMTSYNQFNETFFHNVMKAAIEDQQIQKAQLKEVAK